MSTNPYETVNVVPDVPITSSTFAGPNPIFRSRTPIILVALGFAWTSVSAFIVFAINLTSSYTGTDAFVNQQKPYWTVFFLFKGFEFGYLSFLLWTYQKAIKNWPLKTSAEERQFSVAHNRVWTFTAFFVILNFAISFVYELVSELAMEWALLR